MKKYEELTPEQQEKAVDILTNELLKDIVEGNIKFSNELNKNDLQARIDMAFEKAEGMHTPWFAHEYIMDTCAEDIKAISIANAELCLYDVPEDPRVIYGVITG